jgi:hypothetical protein
VGFGLGALATIACLFGAGAPAGRASTPAPIPVTYSVTGTGRVIPRAFLGLSMEYTSLPTYEQMGPLFSRVAKLFRSEAGGPLTLRIGGKSADHTLWQPDEPAAAPRGVEMIGPSWITTFAQFARANDLQTLLDLNLAVHSPKMETDFALAANHALPGGSLIGLEIGNEPDLYDNQPSLEAQRVPSTTGAPPHWTTKYSASDYHRDYLAYATALRRALPHTPLGGPETIKNLEPWQAAIEGLGALSPGFITIHRYPGSSCFGPASPYYPSIAGLLSDDASVGLANSVVSAIAYAHAHAQQLRLDEVNSISCGGNLGVANTFAAALWAPDALLDFVNDGVDSVNWHIRPQTPNAPFHPVVKVANGVTSQTIQPMPELYGLAMFGQLTQPGAKLLIGTESGQLDSTVSIWVVRFNGGTRVLLINKGHTPATVTLKLRITGNAWLRRLLAPSVSATGGVTFGGQTIGADGRWHGTLRTTTVPDRNGQPVVSLPGMSAAMLTIWR